MKIRFYGNRSVVPSPGPDTVRYGGNTHCLVLTSQNGNKLIVNAGSGIRHASELFPLPASPSIGSKDDRGNPANRIDILLSQPHWDHIQGFALFDPIHHNKRQITIYPPEQDEHHDTAILDQMSRSYSVLKFHQLPSIITIKKLKFTEPQPVDINGFNVQGMVVNHPHGGLAYKITCDERTVVIITNNELFAPIEHCYHNFDEWALFCRGADLLIHDARFMNAEMVNKIGLGHSCVNDAIELATAAEVGMLGLTCHDPDATDETLEFMTSKLFEQRPPFSFFFAKEGREMQI